jgi:hypothetical protein
MLFVPQHRSLPTPAKQAPCCFPGASAGDPVLSVPGCMLTADMLGTLHKSLPLAGPQCSHMGTEGRRWAPAAPRTFWLSRDRVSCLTDPTQTQSSSTVCSCLTCAHPALFLPLLNVSPSSVIWARLASTPDWRADCSADLTCRLSPGPSVSVSRELWSMCLCLPHVHSGRSRHSTVCRPNCGDMTGCFSALLISLLCEMGGLSDPLPRGLFRPVDSCTSSILEGQSLWLSPLCYGLCGAISGRLCTRGPVLGFCVLGRGRGGNLGL